ncbi:MAG: glycosyltransferase family 39 protein [Atopobiaceae bacterium]|nr:glycosyltransferase family 39 protein [Atopobiaceae bacterium]
MAGTTTIDKNPRIHDVRHFACLFLALWLATSIFLPGVVRISTSTVREVPTITLDAKDADGDPGNGDLLYADDTLCVYGLALDMGGGNAVEVSFDAELSAHAQEAPLTIDLYAEGFDNPRCEFEVSLRNGTQQVSRLLEYNVSAPDACYLRFMLPTSAVLHLKDVRAEVLTCAPFYVLTALPCLLLTCIAASASRCQKLRHLNMAHLEHWLRSFANRLGREPHWLPVALMFLAGVVLRFVWADYTKVIYTYPDELRYYGIARSLFQGQGTMLYNTPTDFQKLLYSFVLMPTFAIGDHALRLRAIALVNAAVMMSGIAPLYLLAKRLLRNPAGVYAACALFTIMPDLVHTMTFMSEVVFMPLALWLVYGYYVVFLVDRPLSRRYCAHSVLLGLGTYALYLCKEVAVVFPASLGGLLLIEAAGRVILRHSPLDLDLKRTLVGFALLMGAFGTCFVMLKLTAFAGMGNSYNQTSLDVLSLPHRKKYLLHGFFYYLACCLLAMGVIPFVAPLMSWDALPKERRRLYVMLAGILALNAAVIAYTITVREDFPRPIPRSHMRYACYLWLPFICLWLGAADADRRRTRIAPIGIVGLICTVILTLFVYQGSFSGSPVDNMTLAYLNDLAPTRLFLLRHVLVLLLLCYLAYGKEGAVTYRCAFLAAFVVVQFVNNAILIPYTYGQNSVTNDARAQALSVADYIDAHPGEEFLVLSPAKDADEQRLFDTYIDNTNVAVVNQATLLRKKSYPTGTRFAGVTIPPLTDAQEYDLDEVDYLIALGDGAPAVATSDAEPVEIEGVDFAHLYQLKDTTRIPAFR